MKAPWTNLQDLAEKLVVDKLVVDQEPHKQPIAIAFFSQGALMSFLATLESEPEGDAPEHDDEPTDAMKAAGYAFMQARGIDDLSGEFLGELWARMNAERPKE